MRKPVKRVKGAKHCPIDVNTLYRHWERGDKRINWPKIKNLLHRWHNGERISWRKLSHTFVKKGPRPNWQRIREQEERQQERERRRMERQMEYDQATQTIIYARPPELND